MSSRDDPDLTEVAFGDDDKDAKMNRCCSSRSSEIFNWWSAKKIVLLHCNAYGMSRSEEKD
jgi:hypothetical protein